MPKPLLQTVGREFFAGVPRGPGVYVITGSLPNQVLYIGQSRNLRSRLASYKNAIPDRAPRKVIRLVQQVRSITWELCESPEGARLRENELLRLHRPKFNRVNTYPKAYSFIGFRLAGSILEIARLGQLRSGWELYGAFKSGVAQAFPALLRTVYLSLHASAELESIPRRLLAPGNLRKFEYRVKDSNGHTDEVLEHLRGFLSGMSEALLASNSWQTQLHSSLFQTSLLTYDTEILQGFYERGPRRLRVLKDRYGLEEPTVSQEQLDDLLTGVD